MLILVKQVSLPTLKQEVAAVVVQEKADTAFTIEQAEVKEEKPAEKKPKKEKAAKKGKTEKSTGGTQTEGTRLIILLVLRSYVHQKFLCLVV